VAQLSSPESCTISPIRFLPDGVKSDLNQALVLLGLFLHMLVGYITCCLGFLCCYLVVVIFVFLVPAERLVGNTSFLLQSSDWLERSSPK